MAFALPLVIRKTHMKAGWRHPIALVQSTIRLCGVHYKDPRGWTELTKGWPGWGRIQCFDRTEQEFVFFLLSNYGPGKYTVLVHKGRYKSFWNGYIEWDRFVRYRGNIAPYLKPETPQAWHNIQVSIQKKMFLMEKRPQIEEYMQRQIDELERRRY